MVQFITLEIEGQVKRIALWDIIVLCYILHFGELGEAAYPDTDTDYVHKWLFIQRNRNQLMKQQRELNYLHTADHH